MHRKQSRPWGAHMSIAGGVSKAVTRGSDVGARAIQIFTKNNNRWEGKPLSADEIEKFNDNIDRLNVKAHASHDCYLINLASPDKELIKKSRTAFLDEIDRADALGIPCLVFHPGSHMGKGASEGLKRVADSIDFCVNKRPEIKTTLTIETTAGQGTGLGHRFEEIASIIDNVQRPELMGVCVDTCHIFAAGYEINTAKGYKETFEEFDETIGLGRLKMFHVNDSKKELGSRVDRHEHIGKGFIGAKGFRFLVNDKRFTKTPMILETPKGADGAEDIVNLEFLNSLIN
ncbi:Endonuclease IV [hydrothermal vent metagenome]|uniref:Endonuclease IV n=1 Tax=hydrothermal vent metagenome TaxID=652676 RepID=A0A3B1D5R3_9ZZZZ